jgi:toxin ParE1/3/4
MEFAEQLEDALRPLATHPAIGSRRYADLLAIPGLRSWPIKQSAYLIFYLAFRCAPATLLPGAA